MFQTTYKDDAMGNIQVYECFSLFKKCEMSIGDKSRSGHPSTFKKYENTKKVRVIVLGDRRRTTEAIAELSGWICSRWTGFPTMPMHLP